MKAFHRFSVLAILILIAAPFAHADGFKLWPFSKSTTPTPKPTPKAASTSHTGQRARGSTEKKADAPAAVDTFNTDLLAAMDSGDLDAVKKVVERIADPKERADRLNVNWEGRASGANFLESSLVHPNFEIFNYMIEQGAPVKSTLYQTARSMRPLDKSDPEPEVAARSAEIDKIVGLLKTYKDSAPKFDPAVNYAKNTRESVEKMLADLPASEVPNKLVEMIGTTDPDLFPLFQNAAKDEVAAILATTAPLQKAIRAHDVRAVDALIALGADPDQLDQGRGAKPVRELSAEIDDDQIRSQMGDVLDRKPGTPRLRWVYETPAN